MFSVRNYISGWCEFSFAESERGVVFDLLFQRDARFFGERVSDGRVYVGVILKYVDEIRRDLTLCGVEYTVTKAHGIGVLLRALLFRPAIILGIIVFFVWIGYSSKLIWDVRVTGNTKTSDDEIKALLSELGCGVGDYYPSIDFSRVHANYAAAQDDIAWLSVYMNGTVAEVQVRELYKDTRDRHKDGVYASVVATCDGVVEQVNVFEGQAVVRVGDIVRTGDVLISGIVDTKDGGVRYEYAAGEVICTVPDPISINIELERDEKVYTGEIFTKKCVKIFKKTINILGKGGIEGATYDKIDTMVQLCPFGLVNLPVWITKSEYREYVIETITVSPDEAADLALLKLSEIIKEKTAGASLISRDMRINVTSGAYTLDCLLYLSRDIGATAEFKLNSSGE